MNDHLYRAFKERLPSFLADHPIPHALDYDGDFYHVTIPARGPSGFPIHVNVGWPMASIVVGDGAILEFHADDTKEAAVVVENILELTRRLAGGGVRLRLHKAGETTRAWAIEIRQGSHWVVAHHGRHWLFNYFGKRSEVVLENRVVGTAAPAG